MDFFALLLGVLGVCAVGLSLFLPGTSAVQWTLLGMAAFMLAAALGIWRCAGYLHQLTRRQPPSE